MVPLFDDRGNSNYRDNSVMTILDEAQKTGRLATVVCAVYPAKGAVQLRPACHFPRRQESEPIC